jgi:hypothetical protein
MSKNPKFNELRKPTAEQAAFFREVLKFFEEAEKKSNARWKKDHP